MTNIAFATERLDLDINTPISIEDDVVPADELMTMGPGYADNATPCRARGQHRHAACGATIGLVLFLVRYATDDGA